LIAGGRHRSRNPSGSRGWKKRHHAAENT
jgi:hypothetical protein